MSIEIEEIVGVGGATERLVFLDTAQIIELAVTNVRPWASRVGDDEKEIKAIEALAATIEEEGQIQPVRVRQMDGDGVFELIAGRRRKKAIELINAGRKSGEEMKVMAIVSSEDVTDPSAFRQAMIENIHREGISAMEMYDNIQTLRNNFKWLGKSGTKKVADYLKVSNATVTQYELLGKLPEDLQAKVHSGELTRDNAFMLAAISEKQGPDAARAVEGQAQDAAQAVEVEEGVSAGAEETSTPGHPTPGEAKDAKKARAVAKKKAAAKTKVIKKAVREADPSKPKPRSRSEIIEFFTACYGPAYGYANGTVHQFVDAFEKYTLGVVGDRTLYKYFDAMVKDAYLGTPEKGEAKVDAKADAGTKGKGKTSASTPAKKKAAKKK